MALLSFLCLLLPLWVVTTIIGSFIFAAYMIARGC
jgi:hypothetical protein